MFVGIRFDAVVGERGVAGGAWRVLYGGRKAWENSLTCDGEL